MSFITRLKQIGYPANKSFEYEPYNVFADVSRFISGISYADHADGLHLSGFYTTNRKKLSKCDDECQKEDYYKLESIQRWGSHTRTELKLVDGEIITGVDVYYDNSAIRDMTLFVKNMRNDQTRSITLIGKTSYPVHSFRGTDDSYFIGFMMYFDMNGILKSITAARFLPFGFLMISKDCVMSDWSDWGMCQGEYKERKRRVISHPEYDGDRCPKDTIEKIKCTEEEIAEHKDKIADASKDIIEQELADLENQINNTSVDLNIAEQNLETAEQLRQKRIEAQEKRLKFMGIDENGELIDKPIQLMTPNEIFTRFWFVFLLIFVIIIANILKPDKKQLLYNVEPRN